MKAALITSVALCCLACGGKDEQLQPSALPAPRSTAGLIEGVVQAQVYFNAFQCRLPQQCNSFPPAAGAAVSVVDGQGAGVKAATDANGRYRLEVPTGTVRLKFSLAGYDDQFSSTYTIDQNAVVTLPPAMLRMSAWAVGGLVTDSGGRGVAGADVGIGDTLGVLVGNATTDTSGRYRYASTAFGIPHPPQISVSVQKAGYEVGYTQQYAACCNVGEDTVVNLQIGPRIVNVTLVAPTSIRVGDSVEVRGRIVRDDGADSTTPAGGLTSSDPSVIKTQLAQLPTGTGVTMTGLATGTATISWTYNGFVATSRIVVTAN
jgi:hypothetical protein